MNMAAQKWVCVACSKDLSWRPVIPFRLSDAFIHKRQLTLLTTLPQLSWTAEEINRRLDNQLIICVDQRRALEFS